MQILKNTKVTLEGRGLLTIRPADYVTSGGEGAIYRSGNLAIKLYEDADRMIREGLPDKLQLLHALAHPSIVAPGGLVNDGTGKPIGFYMPFTDGEPLPRIFTNAFWQRTSFSNDAATQLIEHMREVTRFAHAHGTVMVDPNEMNWLVDIGKIHDPKPIAIDVDSWAIGRWGPSAVMPSIRDWHTTVFDANSDWFAFGVVTFQVWSDIHPYKGTLAGYKPGELERRMKENASVFSPGIVLNRAVRDFANIPGALRAWYEEVFQKGLRSEPPSPLDKGVAAIAPRALTYRAVAGATGLLVFEKIFEQAGNPVVRIWPCGVVLTRSGTLVDLATKRTIASNYSERCEIIRTENGWLGADIVGGQISCSFIDDRTLASTALPVPVNGHTLVRYANRLFVPTEGELVELELLHTTRPLLTIRTRTQILQPKATRWFEGVGVQTALGATFLVLPFKDQACTTVRVKELDRTTVIAAKAGHRFITAVAIDAQGAYIKHEFSFTEDYRSYRTWSGPADTPELNIAILERGVCATVVQDGTLHIFVPSSGNMKSIQDAHVRTDMQLATWKEQVVYLHRGSLWSLRMK